jgi:hypothetical protein
MPQAAVSVPTNSTTSRSLVSVSGCNTSVDVLSVRRPSVMTSDGNTIQNNHFVKLMHNSRCNDSNSIITSTSTSPRMTQQPVHATTPLILNLTSLPGSGGLLILSSQSVEQAVSNRPSPAIESSSWSGSDGHNVNDKFPVKTSCMQLSNDTILSPSKTSLEIKSEKSESSLNFQQIVSSKCGNREVAKTDIERLNAKFDCHILESVPFSQASFCSGYSSLDLVHSEVVRTNGNEIAGFDCLSLLFNQSDGCVTNVPCSRPPTGSDNIQVNSGDTGNISKKLDSDLIVDELDDILHLVNESLSHCESDENASSSLQDYGISIGDGFRSIESQNRLQAAAEVDNAGGPLVKITDYSPDWSHIEVIKMQLALYVEKEKVGLQIVDWFHLMAKS